MEQFFANKTLCKLNSMAPKSKPWNGEKKMSKISFCLKSAKKSNQRGDRNHDLRMQTYPERESIPPVIICRKWATGAGALELPYLNHLNVLNVVSKKH